MEGTGHEALACIQCDLLVNLPELQEGERAACPRCNHLIASRTPNGLTRSLAFAIAAAMLLVMAHTFPFLSMSRSGLESVMTLPKTALELYRDGYGAMAAMVVGFVALVPALMIGTVIALVTTLLRRRRATWLVPAGRALFWLTPWSMVEVFIIGVIVSLVKIGHMATVVIGVSFWSYTAFALCFTWAMSSLDRIEVWEEIERYGT